MLDSLLDLPVPVPEKIVRTIAVYLALAVLLRLAGKRDLAQLNTMDLVVVLLLSNVVQNAIIGPDNSLLGGVIGAVVLIGFNALVNRVVQRSDAVARLLEGTATVLATDGRWDEHALAREGLRRADVEAAVRRQNASGVGDTESVTLEPGGSILTTVRPGQQPASRADVERLEAKLDALLARSG
jgi:uncharacterized membrane protein YcaP (DUF421 family)